VFFCLNFEWNNSQQFYLHDTKFFDSRKQTNLHISHSFMSTLAIFFTFSQACANLQTTTTCHNDHFDKVPFSNFITQSFLWTTTTVSTAATIFGSQECRVYLYLYTHSHSIFLSLYIVHPIHSPFLFLHSTPKPISLTLTHSHTLSLSLFI